MASLIEELINVLEEENKEYEVLVSLSKEKTPVIIKGDTEELREMVTKEQIHVDRIANLENKRIDLVNDVATVLNRDKEHLTVRMIVGLLNGQTKEQERLSLIHDKLKRTLKDMVAVNNMNKNLIMQAESAAPPEEGFADSALFFKRTKWGRISIFIFSFLTFIELNKNPDFLVKFPVMLYATDLFRYTTFLRVIIRL